MNGSLVRFRPVARLAPALVCLAGVSAAAPPESPSPAPATTAEGLVDQGARDPRLKGIAAPRGFRVDLVAAETEVGPGPVAMAWDDRGGLLVAGWTAAARWFDVDETIHPPGGDPARVRRSRKNTTDVVRHLIDRDGDGSFEAAEVVLEGAEQPMALAPGKDHLLLACNGRLERWDDADGDGRYEARTVLLDGFPGSSKHGLGGITRGLDGWLYLATGDGPGHVAAGDGRRIDVDRAGSIFRCRPDGTQLHPFASGFADPRGGVAFDSKGQPWLVDDDQEDGSKFQGVRLIQPVEDGDYGWRRRPDGQVDAERAGLDGDRPGKLAPAARLGRSTPGGLVACLGAAFPRECRGLLIDPDPVRHAVRGLRVEPRPGARPAVAETPLLVGDGDFRPGGVSVGPDGSLYVLDIHPAPDDDAAEDRATSGRILRLRWVGTGPDAGGDAKPAPKRFAAGAPIDQLLPVLAGEDAVEAARALRELVRRGPDARTPLLAVLGDPKQPASARLLALQGLRPLWDETVEPVVAQALGDPDADVRRLAVQALAWEPRRSEPPLVARLAPLFADPDPRVAREAVLAIGRHADARPGPTAVILARRLFADLRIDPTLRDGIIRALERLGDAGVEELAVAVRARHGADRERAIAFWTALRSPAAAERLPGLVVIPDLTAAERIALIRHHADFPASVNLPTQGLADWLARHSGAEPAVKLAVLDACRMAGNPASALVLRLLDDDDEPTRIAATEAAARSRPPGSMARIEGRLRQAGTSAAERMAAVRALGGYGPPAFAAIEAATAKASDDPGYTVARLRALDAADRDKARPALVAALAIPDPEVHAESVRLLGRSADGAIALARARVAGTIGRDDQAEIHAALARHADRPGVRPAWEELDRVAAAPEKDRKGDPWRGLDVLFRDRPTPAAGPTALVLAGPVGPLLADHADWLDARALARAFGAPAKAAPAGFVVTRLTLADGRVVEGTSARSDDRGVTLRAASGGETTFADDQIARREEVGVRIDPAAFAGQFSGGDAADLVAFLASSPAREAMRLGPKRLDRVLAIGPMEGGADRLRAPLNRVDPARSLPGQDGTPVAWTALEASEAGAFELRGQFGNRPGRAFVAAEVRGESGAEAALRFAADGPARVYLNGARVAGVGEPDPEAVAPAFAPPREGMVAPMPGLVRLNLADGWNLVVVALDRPAAGGTARLALEVVSPRPVEVRVPRASAPAPAATAATDDPDKPKAETATTPTPGRNR